MNQSKTLEELYELPISQGAGDDLNTLCVQQKANAIRLHMAGVMDKVDMDDLLTDNGCWQNEIINDIGIRVNDSISVVCPEKFWELDSMTPRLVAATKRLDPDKETRVNLRLMVAMAKKYINEVDEIISFHPSFNFGRPANRSHVDKCLDSAKRALSGEISISEFRQTAPRNLTTLDPLWDDLTEGIILDNLVQFSSCVFSLNFPIISNLKPETANRLIDYMDWILSQWEKACAEEGAVLEDGWLEALREAGLLEDAELVEKEY